MSIQTMCEVDPFEEMLAALNTDATARRILGKGLKPELGEVVGVRLNINILKSTGVAVHSIHKGNSSNGYQVGRGLFRGEVLTFAPWAVLKDAFFNVHQKGRELIASGAQSKHPMASIDGQWVPADEEPDFSGVEISFNPKRVHLFVDSVNRPVQYAQHVAIRGHRAFATGQIVYFDELTAPARAGDTPSCAVFEAHGRH